VVAPEADLTDLAEQNAAAGLGIDHLHLLMRQVAADGLAAALEVVFAGREVGER
jgi:hypothetical protein